MEESRRKINLYNLFSNISIYFTIGLVVLLILMITGVINYSQILLEIVFILLILSITSTVSLTWIQKLMKGKYKVLSWVMIGILSVFAILWIATIFVIVNFFNNVLGSNGSDVSSQVASFLSYIQVVLIMSVQFILSSFVANTITYFGKSNYILQGLNYLSIIMVDVWLCKLLTLINFNNDAFTFNNADFLTSKGWWALFLISAAILAITSGSISKIHKRKLKEQVQEMTENESSSKQSKKATKQEDSLEEKLKKLKDLLDKGLITEKEYAKKREKLLEDI